MTQSHSRLRKAISMAGKKKLISDLPQAFKLVVWELMKTQTALKKLKDKVNK